MRNNKINYFVFAWAIIGFTAIIIFALVRLVPNVIQATEYPLERHHWILLCAWCLFMLWSEGYKGFQQRFSPRFANRAYEISLQKFSTSQLLAPAYCLSYFSASKRRIITAWAATFLIVLFIIVAKQLSQPWRGIIDAGVVIGLTYGLGSVYYLSIKRLID